jgi:hypothetical protein
MTCPRSLERRDLRWIVGLNCGRKAIHCKILSGLDARFDRDSRFRKIKGMVCKMWDDTVKKNSTLG